MTLQEVIMGKLNGKVAIVTGASRGIGKEIALLYAAEGASVVCTARTVNEGDHRRFPGSLATTVAEIEAAGGRAIGISADLSVEESLVNLVAKTREAFGPVDILVNNGQMTYLVPIKDLTVKHWDISWAVGPRAVFILCHEVLPDMITKHSGTIINVSSGAAIGPGRGPYKNVDLTFADTKYGAQKACLERFSQGLAQEVYQYGIAVMALAPSGVVVTPTTLFSGKAISPDDPKAEPPGMTARAALLLAGEPLDKVTGRVVYSMAILKEYGLIKEGKGPGIDRPGSGYSRI
jgi:citronellol/citronellal dehydrogenase